MQQLYEFDAHEEDLTQGVKPMSRSLWKYRRQVTVEHLGNSFQQEVLSGEEQRQKVLYAFLKQVTPMFKQLSLHLRVVSASRDFQEAKYCSFVVVLFFQTLVIEKEKLIYFRAG